MSPASAREPAARAANPTIRMTTLLVRCMNLLLRVLRQTRPLSWWLAAVRHYSERVMTRAIFQGRSILDVKSKRVKPESHCAIQLQPGLPNLPCLANIANGSDLPILPELNDALGETLL